MFTLAFFIAPFVCWAVFIISFTRDRSRYYICHLLFIALLSLLNWPILFGGFSAAVIVIALTTTALLIVPVFLVINGIITIRREGKSLSHFLSLALGIVIFIGEAATAANLFLDVFADRINTPANVLEGVSIADSVISVTVIYGSLAFLCFMLYTVFLQLIPRRRDYDYVIIHGAGLLDGNRISALLRDRLEKAIQVYRRDPTPPIMIPSGGQGSDETISEAEAMKQYLLGRGIPEEDVVTEALSVSTYENIRNSKAIIDGRPGRKYTALITSNYHVYRALRYCRSMGMKCTGIGSHVALYYWPSALIREFIAIHMEKKHAVIFLAGWAVCVAIAVLVTLWAR